MVDWTNSNCTIDNLALEPIMIQVLMVKGRFEENYFAHVYQELNSLADQFSKEALQLQEGLLSEQKFRGDSEVAAPVRVLF